MFGHRAETISRNRALQRYCFVAGLPRSGISVLMAVLAQNPAFVARIDSPAESVFRALAERFAPGAPEADRLSGAERLALLRGGIDAIYHDRPFGAMVVDANRAWLGHIEALAQLYPLSRFVICLRNPAQIVNSLAVEGETADDALSALIGDVMAPDGAVGAEMEGVRAALASMQAERIFVLDYDRMVDDPEGVMDVLYDFLRMEPFDHDFAAVTLWGEDVPIRRSDKPGVLPNRTMLQLSGRAFWRNLRRTEATMLLGRAR
jgi:sulfotransferase